jgi:hypothetical protein
MRTDDLSFRLSLLGRGGYSFHLSTLRRIRWGERKGGGRGLLFLCTAVLLLFGFAVTSEAFKLPDTGQTKCYRGVDPYDEIPCAGTGQDGDYSINPLSYTDNGNGMVTDNNTGLIWQKYENAPAYNWYQASGTYHATYNPTSQNVCGSLNLGGYSDWRLPSKKELITIVDYSIPYPGPTVNIRYFPNTHASYYWSSTTYVFSQDFAWHVAFYYGYVGYDYGEDRSDGMYVRCVRGGQLDSGNFQDNLNGTVTDNKTGLMWQQGEPGRMKWDAALSYCEGLPLGGHSDWRLPNIKELESLTDDTRYEPAIDTNFFPNAYASSYCSSTTSGAMYSEYAWYVSFYNGWVDFYGYGGFKVNDVYVRCVRGGQSGSSDDCTYNLSHPTKQFTSSGGEDTVTVSASSQNCQWTATESLDWVTITSGTSGTGSGSVSYTVSANSSQSQRIGSMTIAGKSFSINQDPLSPIPTGTPKMSVSPRSLNFGPMKAGASAQKMVTISNSGTGQLLVNSISISGANAAEFSQTNNCTAVASKGTCTVTVTFNPTLPFGKKVASLMISSNDAKKSTISVNLSGQASASKISVKPSSLSFGTMVVGGTPVIKTVKVFNKGLSDLMVNSLGITGTNASEFSQTNDCGTVQAGGTCNVSVTYTPNDQTGKKNALLVISSNDPKKPNLNVKLTARIK